MAPWSERFKAKLGRKKPLTSPPSKASSTSTIPQASTVPDPTASSPSLPERLWNQGYDQAKTSDSSIVDTYEIILSAQLSQKYADHADPADLASQKNNIEQNPEKRWIQMCQLVQDGLHRTEKEAKMKQGMEDGIQVAMTMKAVVDKAIQAAPEAALAWVGVCLALEILMNPLTQASSNRKGIAYVVSRMDWYWNLSTLLLDENTEAHYQGLRGELEKNIIQLYGKLLLYQMKSVCYYHRTRLLVFARDLVKLNNWDGELNDVQDAEAAVEKDSAQYNTLSIRSHLSSIAETAKSQNTKLDSISSAIQEQTKRQERMHETDADNKCLADMCSTNPHHDKKRIEDTKGGLLQDSYLWILKNPDFQQWLNDRQSRLLWIKADPGKGKTMLLCGIIDELKKLMAPTGLLSYFFCQATDSRINNATAVLRGLVYLLVDQQPSLISHIRKKYDQVGKSLFEDVNAWVALSEIFTNIMQDPSLDSTYLVVDALDECVADLPKLLDFIVQSSSTPSRVKWIISSRNWPDIEERLERAGHKVRLSLELNAKSVSTGVKIFIQHKVLRLAEQKKYDEKTRDAVLNHLSLNANDTFLWVALVCQNLETTPRWGVPAKLKAFPPGLDSLYKRMMQHICSSDNADLCKRILASIAIVYRPITLKELTFLDEALESVVDDLESLRDIISLCGSFLTLREDTVYFVHQSAKDFLLAKASEDIFPSGRVEAQHYIMFSRSLQAMSKTLHRDMYNLRALGYPAEQVKQPDQDPLAVSRYSCIYWVDHLCDSNSSANHEVCLQDRGPIHEFIRKKYLYWLEALSLCKSMSKGVLLMAKLETLIQGRADASALTKLVQDARRFIMYHKWAIENSPLQVYASALIFSPARSLIKSLFEEEVPKWITIKPAIRDKWGTCLQTLEGDGSTINSVALSNDSAWLASALDNGTIKIWYASSGECVRTLKGHSDSVRSVAFSHDSARLASASEDQTVKIWDVNSGECLQTLKGHSSWVLFVAFPQDSSTQLASASQDKTVKIWDENSGECLQTLKGHSGGISSVAFSHDSAWLASASSDYTAKIWDTSSGECLQTLEGHSSLVYSVAFSHNDSTQLASSSFDYTAKIWDASSGECVQTLKDHSGGIRSVAFSHNSAWLASASDDMTIKIWDANSGECLQTLEGHSDIIMSVVFSSDSTQLASASYDNTIKIWDASISGISGEYLQTLEGHSKRVNKIAFSQDSTQLASASYDKTIKIWDANSGKCLQTLEGHNGEVIFVTFSPDSTQLASASYDCTAKIWDASSGECLQTLDGHRRSVLSVAFSYDSTKLASTSSDYTAKIWDTRSGECLQTLRGHSGVVSLGVFSQGSTRLASSSSYDDTIKIWDLSSGECLHTFEVGEHLTDISFDTTGSYLYTEIGSIAISAESSVLSTIPTFMERQNPRYQGVGLSPDGEWITHNSEDLVWLPSEYRPSCSAVAGKRIAISGASGKIWIYHIDLEKS